MQRLLVNRLLYLVFFLLGLNSGDALLGLLFALAKDSLCPDLALGQDGRHFLLHVEYTVKGYSLLGQQTGLLHVLRESIQHKTFPNTVEVLHPLGDELENERIRDSLALEKTFPDDPAILDRKDILGSVPDEMGDLETDQS